jgi:hypothetical protein
MCKRAKVAGTPNPVYVAADQERRRSSVASPQESGHRRERTRRKAKQAAVRDSRGY